MGMPEIQAIRTFRLPAQARRELLDMCNSAFGMPFDALFDMLPPDGLHLLGRIGGRLVAHLVITDRCLRADDGPWLRTAYIDAVATHPQFQRQGNAGTLIRRAVQSCSGRYELLALATDTPTLYAKYGFVKWPGAQMNETEDGTGVEISPEQNNLMVLPCTKAFETDQSATMTANWRPGGGW